MAREREWEGTLAFMTYYKINCNPNIGSASGRGAYVRGNKCLPSRAAKAIPKKVNRKSELEL